MDVAVCRQALVQRGDAMASSRRYTFTGGMQCTAQGVACTCRVAACRRPPHCTGGASAHTPRVAKGPRPQTHCCSAAGGDAGGRVPGLSGGGGAGAGGAASIKKPKQSQCAPSTVQRTRCPPSLCNCAHGPSLPRRRQQWSFMQSEKMMGPQVFCGQGGASMLWSKRQRKRRSQLSQHTLRAREHRVRANSTTHALTQHTRFT